MKVLIGTKNPGKIEGAKEAFERFFEDVVVEGIAVASNVSPQPVNDEIVTGAKNRVKNLVAYAKENGIVADYYIAIESGIQNYFGSWMITNVAVVRDSENYESVSTSASFPIPNKYVDEAIEKELSYIMDKIFDKKDMRNNKGGISGLTNDVITRIDLTREAFIMALTQYINESWNDKK